MKTLLILLLLGLISFSAFSQANQGFKLEVGATFNASKPNTFDNTTGIGVLIEPIYYLNERIRFGVRFEPTALAYGILTYENHSEIKEGASYLLIHALKTEYFFGEKKLFYAGIQGLVLTHQRHILTSRVPGNFMSEKRNVTNLGIGVRAGVLLKKFDLSVSANETGKDFLGFVGFNLGYQLDLFK